ncbi:hypothetical protein TanjilG_10212 [Lupinus angustifolius]|uniref:Plant-specific domain TIGR01615 family protein n=1 Tax=Lupinus angustifolius TaxID=3871 RepID=A0A4P1RBP8_LUPAN|nr:PREDICTED: uncharacterized protein LOC109354888 [Lupinus angustifolius]OIW07377.1 hypothetical protein TanjilG_10212 [Lupinus angustifolius]
MDFKVCVSAGVDLWVSVGGVGGGGFSHESEHDLAMMVSDFLENGSSGAESWCSSDSDSGLSDFAHLAEKIQICKLSVAPHESDLLSTVHSLIRSMNETDLQSKLNSGPCYASCIRFYLVKLMKLSGYDAGVCASKWQGSGKVPGGDHEYIDVVVNNNSGGSERLIIDIDFRSHFEIARAVDSYNTILKSLPVVYVGSFTRLKQFLVIMEEATRSSLKQNSMPLPPWRSLAYLQAKWQSPYERYEDPEGNNIADGQCFDHKQCHGHLKRLQSCLQSAIDTDRLLKPRHGESNWRMKPDRWRHPLFRPI